MEEKNIDRLINSVGTNTFVTYFWEFKHLDKGALVNLFALNNEDWKDVSNLQKASNGKRIFHEEREYEALQHIIANKNAENIPEGNYIIKKAKLYLTALTKIYILLLLFISISCNKSAEEQKTNTLSKKSEMNLLDSLPEIKKLEEKNENIPIKQIINLAQEHFDTYKKQLLTKNTLIGLNNAYTGDFTNDGKEDVVIYYSIEPTDGGNYIAGQGLVLYKNNGSNVSFITSYSPDYFFSFDKVSGGNIFISKDEYAEDDPRCCPSLHKQIELTVSGDKIYERNIK